MFIVSVAGCFCGAEFSNHLEAEDLIVPSVGVVREPPEIRTLLEALLHGNSSISELPRTPKTTELTSSTTASAAIAMLVIRNVLIITLLLLRPGRLRKNKPQ